LQDISMRILLAQEGKAPMKGTVSFRLPLEKAGLVFFLEEEKRRIDEAFLECLEVFRRKFNRNPEILELEEGLYEELKAASRAKGSNSLGVG